MIKTALLFCLIFALFAGTWTMPCMPRIEVEHQLPPHPAGEWSIYEADPALEYTGTATAWTGPLAEDGRGIFHEISVTVWIFDHLGPNYAVGKYYTETGQIELTWLALDTATDWLEFTGTDRDGTATGRVVGHYKGATISTAVEAHRKGNLL